MTLKTTDLSPSQIGSEKEQRWRNKPTIQTKRPSNLFPNKRYLGKTRRPKGPPQTPNRPPTPGASCQPLNDTAENPTRHGNRAAMWPKPCDKFYTFDLTSPKQCSRQQATNNFP
ncbi:hypothetical protein LAZ67_2003167 [Cordylochernes scorpioides]|uniref:Uncharacterized protein n=1 Tax=Cordylochernes scorpioides TaxID=51811 RepID=A0ABY6K2N9_9ARAC|nr:hypothetical protein LAZ67_2003167 [Cordylochernes scorpioides]